MNSAMINGFSDELQQIHKHASNMGTVVDSALNRFATRGALSKAVPGEALNKLKANAAEAARHNSVNAAAQQLGRGPAVRELTELNLPHFKIPKPSFTRQ